MPTPRETILQALLAALQSVPDATILRGAILPERIPAGGLLILRDGDPGTPEVTLSPLQYHYEHRVAVEVIVQGKTPAERDVVLMCCWRNWHRQPRRLAPLAGYVTGWRLKRRNRLICLLKGRRR